MKNIITALIISFCLLGCFEHVTLTGGASKVVDFEKDGKIITSISIYENTSIDDVKIVINGAPADANNYAFTLVSDDQVLLPDENIVLEGEGKFRNLTITPAPNQSGQTTLTGTVTDTSTNETRTGSLLFIVLPVDDTAPTLTEVTPVPTPTADHVPEYTFHSTEAGIILYSGNCSSISTDASQGNNTIRFNTLSDGTYDNCAINVRDVDGNTSATLDISSFTILTVPEPCATCDGITITSFDLVGSDANTVIQQSSGKYVLAGNYRDDTYDFALARYNYDGSLDTTFGDNGKVITAIGTGSDIAKAMVQQSDGKMVVVGTSLISDFNYALVRYHADGALDDSFGINGKVTSNLTSGKDVALSIVQQDDGKLVVAGYSAYGSNNENVLLARYNLDGTLDPSFGDNGVVLTAVSPYNDSASSVIQQSDGKLVIAGIKVNTPVGSSIKSDALLIRYNPDGSLDASFGTDGIVTTTAGILERALAHDLIQQSDGKLVLTGGGFDVPYTDIIVFRYELDGSVDTSFGTGGMVETPVGEKFDSGSSIIQQSDGKLVVAGSSLITYYDINLVRYNIDGSLDTTFVGAAGLGNGTVTTNLAAWDDEGKCVIQQGDGKLIVAGYGYKNSIPNFAIVRYNTDGTLDTTNFGPD